MNRYEEGKTVERKARRVRIRDIRIVSMNLPRAELEITCSKGTYIRTLCHDIGERLGIGGCMETLVRTRSGPFGIEESYRLEELQEKTEKGELSQTLIPIDVLFSQYQKIQIRQELEARLKNGNPFSIPGIQTRFSDQEYVRVYDSAGNFAAIYKYMQENRQFRTVKMFL